MLHNLWMGGSLKRSLGMVFWHIAIPTPRDEAATLHDYQIKFERPPGIKSALNDGLK